MTSAPPSETNAAGPRLVETVSSWPGVAVGPHRLGMAEFTVDGREIGHTHSTRVVDINFPKRVADHLLATGETNDHHFAGGGWTTFAIDSDADVDQAIRLLRLSYLLAALTLRRKPAGEAILADLDVDTELESLELDEEVEAVVERMRPDTD